MKILYLLAFVFLLVNVDASKKKAARRFKYAELVYPEGRKDEIKKELLDFMENEA